MCAFFVVVVVAVDPHSSKLPPQAKVNTGKNET